MRRLFVVAMLLVAALSAGCKMSVNMTTTVLPTVEMDQEMILKLEGIADDSTQQLFQSDEAAGAADGWTQEVKQEGDTVTMRSYKRLKSGDSLLPPSEGDEASSKPTYDLQVIDMPQEREYRLSIFVPASESSAPTSDPTLATADEEVDRDMAVSSEEVDPDMAIYSEDMAKAMAEMFKVSWTVNLPGRVVDTNADIRTETGGTWEFGLGQTEGRELKIVSREPKS